MFGKICATTVHSQTVHGKHEKPQAHLNISAGGVAFPCAQLFRRLCPSGWESKSFSYGSDKSYVCVKKQGLQLI